ncbi:uncharacterized protein LOC143214168 [Lasioglossum baleicum]|uniref:uncharacterized protein LOC143214168 n=1 Tax=Lasioglossum baleicum TaxID=434251 RepID=UPI003FCC5198
MLIDDGSQRSYITKAAATRLGYQPIAEQLMNHSLFGGEKSGTVKHNRYLIRESNLEEDFKCNFNAFDQNVICEAIPTVKGGPWKKELEALNIKISDIDKSDEAISVLVGADVAGKLMTGRRHILKCGLVAVETYLGWTVMGAMEQTEKRDDPVITAHTMFVNSQKAADLWSLDVLGIKDPVENKSQRDHQREVKEDFLKTVYKNAEGRYEVKLPWLKSHPALNDNKIMAIRRLQSTIKKLKTDGLFEEYAAIFNEWRNEGIVEYVPEGEKDNWGHYLPHRHVVKENSTTRVRPVFDASAKSHPFPSLNECLEKGENLIEQIPSILLRFRKGNIGVISDIRKAFLQISLDRNDRNFLRFLWINEGDDIVMLRHCRVVFGVSSSPFILGAVIAMHLDNVVSSLSCDPKAKNMIENVKKLSESFYVDNCVTSVNTLDQLHSFIGDAKTVMQSAGFDLRGWEHRDDGSRENRTAVLAKNRVAPMNKDSTDARQSIPRLELLAATIAVRLTATILDALKLDCRDVFYWSDSSTVITWIRKNSNWATFVYNRVKEIREFSNSEQWRHVPGNLNPADLPSRGCTTDQLLVSRWWEGPEWLRLKSENWPSNVYEYNEEEVYKELKKCATKDMNRTILLVRNENSTVNDKLRYTEKFSEYRKTVRVLAWIKRHDARPLESVPVPLPLDRVKDASVFEVVGVDFAGPIYLKGDQKAWICLFTCAVYRAIHLELVTSLSTASFLMALRRHIARRGRPSVVYSDNGTNFVGTANLLKKVDFDKLSKITSTERIEWKFNPPTAAWWGGFWERLIGVLKRLLRRTLKKSCLNYEEMLTVLLDCEATVNSRPITFMSDDSPDVVPLSPSMFLQEVKEIGVLDLDHIENCQLDKKFRYRQKLKEALRQRFRSEYLGALMHKRRKASADFSVNVGDIVFVEKESVKRLDWPLARVKRVFVGKDDNVRVVRLVTAEGEMTRPIQRIYPLEIKGNESMSNVNDVLIERYKRAPRNEPLGDVCEMNNEHDGNNANTEQGYVTRSGRKIVRPDRFNLLYNIFAFRAQLHLGCVYIFYYVGIFKHIQAVQKTRVFKFQAQALRTPVLTAQGSNLEGSSVYD